MFLYMLIKKSKKSLHCNILSILIKYALLSIGFLLICLLKIQHSLCMSFSLDLLQHEYHFFYSNVHLFHWSTKSKIKFFGMSMVVMHNFFFLGTIYILHRKSQLLALSPVLYLNNCWLWWFSGEYIDELLIPIGQNINTNSCMWHFLQLWWMTIGKPCHAFIHLITWSTCLPVFRHFWLS